MGDAEVWRGLPTTGGFAARQAFAALISGKVTLQSALKRAGLRREDLETPRRRISAAAQAKLVEIAAEALDDDLFGLHLAETADPRDFGLLYYVVSTARTLDAAIGLFVRFSRVANESLQLRLERTPDTVAISVTHVGLPRRLAKHITEFQFAATLRAFRLITARQIRPVAVSHAHPRAGDLKAFEKFYGVPVEFSAPIDRLVLSRESAELPLVTEDRHLHETLRPYAEEAARARATAKGSLREAVENEIQRLLPHGKAQAAIIADELGMSTRTLSRRLADEGVAFAEIVDQLRRSLASEYLGEPGFTLAHIAWLLGYEGVTSFHHAYKRWTGRPPSAARRDRVAASVV